MTKISIIAAMDEKNGLGRNNQMAWNIPGELKRFKEITMPHPIIMGRKTFESIGRVLPGRLNIIITRNLDFKVDGAIVTSSIEEALEKAKENEKEEIFIIGGGQIFKDALEKDLVDKLYLTLVDGDYNADAFFPEYSNFTKVIKEEIGENGEFKYRFLDLEK